MYSVRNNIKGNQMRNNLWYRFFPDDIIVRSSLYNGATGKAVLKFQYSEHGPLHTAEFKREGAHWVLHAIVS